MDDGDYDTYAMSKNEKIMPAGIERTNLTLKIWKACYNKWAINLTINTALGMLIVIDKTCRRPDGL